MSLKLRRVVVGKRGRAASPKKAQRKSRRFPGPSRANQSTLEEIYVRRGLIERDRFPHRLSSHFRSSWIVSTTKWLRHGRFIALYVNPSETSWSLPRRETMVKTKAGLVRNVWRNRFRRSYYDEFTINITFQSGNIIPGQPYGPFEDKDSRLAVPSVPSGLSNFYQFMEMLDQEALIGTEENRHIIYYRSRVFPQMYMEGYFSPEPMSFTDSAMNGNTVQWTHTFNVYRTSPRINSAEDMSRVYWSWVREHGANEVVPEVQPRRPTSPLVAAPETLQVAPRSDPGPDATAGGVYSGPGVGELPELA